jgi:hypothetical protein
LCNKSESPISEGHLQFQDVSNICKSRDVHSYKAKNELPSSSSPSLARRKDDGLLFTAEADIGDVFTSSDSNFWDYVRLKDFTKKTGIEKEDCHAFCVKELLDNAADFIEKFRYSNAVITLDIKNDNKAGVMTISVSNTNHSNKAAFDNLDQIFNYKRSYSSKSNQYRITRGAQGDALKELGTMGYMLVNSRESGEDNNWKYPFVFQHNNKIDKVYIEVDRKHKTIRRRFEHSSCDDTGTKVTIMLPAIDEEKYSLLKGLCLDYTLFNTHLSFSFSFNDKRCGYFPALLSMSERTMITQTASTVTLKLSSQTF